MSTSQRQTKGKESKKSPEKAPQSTQGNKAPQSPKGNQGATQRTQNSPSKEKPVQKKPQKKSNTQPKKPQVEQKVSTENLINETSLIHYDTPFLVSSTISNKKLLEELDENNEKSELFLRNIINNYSREAAMDYSVKDALNKVLPPKKVKIGDQMWVRYVSCNPVTRAEIINLHDELDAKLASKGARDCGICPIREKLYGETFDEIIRQVTINTLERGILLVRVKTEIEMTINCYKTLYESCIAYGIRTYLEGEKEKRENAKKISIIEDECEQLAKDIQRLDAELKSKMEKEKKEHEWKVSQHNADMSELKRIRQYLKEDIREKLSFHNK